MVAKVSKKKYSKRQNKSADRLKVATKLCQLMSMKYPCKTCKFNCKD